MDDKWLRDRLVGISDAPIENPPVENNQEMSDPIIASASQVMISYQNANKWLDIIKEELLMEMGCVFFSNYIHNLAHTMPVRFDKFGDILHTADMKIPYPATEYIPYTFSDIDGAFAAIFNILNDIRNSLRAFIKLTQDTEYHGLACSTESLLNEIDAEFPALYRMKRGYVYSNGDTIKFDKWVNQYVNNMSNLLG